MRSLRGSELSKESNTPMATDTEEVIYHASCRQDTMQEKRGNSIVLDIKMMPLKKKSNPGDCFGSTS